MDFKKETNPFPAWIDNIPAGIYTDVRNAIVERCKVTRATFSYWKNDKHAVPPLAQVVINEIAIEFKQPLVFRV